MISAVVTLTCLTLANAQGGEARLTSGSIISDSMIRYARAQSLTGSIVMTQTALGKKIQIATKIQYVRPMLVRIEQHMSGVETGEFHLISDGAVFEYTAPNYLPGKATYLKESVIRPDGFHLEISDMLTAATDSFLDRSSALELLMARRDGLAEFRNRLVDHHLVGKETLDGQDVYKISARWREGNAVPKTDNIDVYFNEKRDIVRVALRQTINTNLEYNPETGRPALPKGNPIVEVTTVWKVEANVGATPDPKGFQLLHP